jgi:hypothetical protein
MLVDEFAQADTISLTSCEGSSFTTSHEAKKPFGVDANALVLISLQGVEECARK